MIAACDTEDEAATHVAELIDGLVGSGGTGGVGWESTVYSKFTDEPGGMEEVLVVHDFQPSVEFNDPDLLELITSESEAVEVILGDISDVSTHRIVTVDLGPTAVSDPDETVEDPDEDPVEG